MALKITNYLKNLGKSIQYAAVNKIRTEHSTVFSTTEQVSTVAKETKNAVVNYKQTFKKVHDTLVNSTVYEASTSAYKNSLEDLKSGKLWNQSREDAVSFGGDEDDFDWSFDEDSTGGDGGDDLDITDGDIAIAKTVNATSKANADQVSSAVMTAAKYSADVSKQTASFMFAQQERLFGNLNNSLNSLGSTMGTMNQFLTGNMQTHIENSTKFFEESTKYQRENNAILKELLEMERERYKYWEDSRKNEQKMRERAPKKNIADIMTNGVMDWGEYGSILKKNIIDEWENFGGGALSKDMIMGLAANPLQAIPTFFAEKLIGGQVDKALGRLNKTLSGALYQLNAGLLDAKKGTGLSEIIGNIFGVRLASKTTIDTSKYNKGQVPFDGVTRKSIVEVIPAYLSRIEKLLGGDERVFDFNTGKFTTSAKLNDQFKRRMDDYKKYASDDVISALRDDFNNLAKANKKISKEDLDYMTRELDHISNKLWENYGSFDKVLNDYNNTKFGELLSMLSKQQGSKTNKAIRTSAAEHAEQKNSMQQWLVNEEKSGTSEYNVKFNDSMRASGKSLLAERNSQAEEHTNILKGMLSELFMIRTSGLRGRDGNIAKSNRLSRMAMPSYIDQKFISDNTIKESRATKVKNRDDKTNIAEQAKAVSTQEVDTDEDDGILSKLDTKKVKLDEIFKDGRTGKFDDVLNAKGYKKKLRNAGDNIFDIIRNPRQFAAEVIDKVDSNLYKLFFDYDTGETDEEGNQIRGFFDKLSHEVKTTFNEIKGWLKEKVWEPIIKKGWNQFKDFAKDLGLDWFNDAKEGFKEEASDALESVTEATTSITSKVDGIINREKEPESVDTQETTTEEKSTTSKSKRNKKKKRKKKRRVRRNAFGSLLVPETGLTTISKGELIIPSDVNPFNPNRDKADRNKDLIEEEKFQSMLFGDGDVMTHAEGGNDIDGDNKILDAVKKKLPDNITKDMKGKKAGDVVGALLNYAVDKLSGKVDKVDGKKSAGIVKEYVSVAFNSGLDKVSEYAKGLDSTIGNSLNKDVENLRKNHAKIVGKAGFGALLGGAGLTAILGPAGLVAGAGLGAAASLIKQSDTAMNFLFGKELEDGSRAGGLVTRKYQAMFKKYAPDIGKGAAAGLIPSLLLGFGPVGAITIGGAYSLANNNKWVNQKLFGKDIYDKDGKVIGKTKGLIPPKLIKYVKENSPKIAGFGSLGAFMLAPTGIGLLPAFAIGAGTGLLGTSNKFHDFLLGKKDKDGKRKGGVAGAIKDHVVSPLAKFGRTLTQDFFSFMNYNIFSPLNMTRKILVQSAINVGKNLKYTMSNVLEKTFGGPFSMLISKRIADVLVNPLGKFIGKTVGGIGGIGKAIFGKTIGGIGSFIRSGNEKANKRMIRKNEANHLSAAERLNIMGDEEYDSKKRDVFLANSGTKELSDLESSLSIVKSQFKITGKEDRKAIKKVEGELKKYLKAGDIRKVTEYMYKGDSRSAIAHIGSIDYLSDDDKKKVASIITKNMKAVQEAVGKVNYSEGEIAQAKEALDKLGLNIDLTDRKSVGYALDQVRNELDRQQTAEELVGVNGEKFSSKGAADVNEGMQETNEILRTLTELLTKNENGANNEKYYDTKNMTADASEYAKFAKGLDDNTKKQVEGDYGHLKLKGENRSFLTGENKDAKRNRKSLSMMPEGMEIDLDQLAKLKATTIERYAQLAAVMGPIAVKSIGNPADLDKLTNRSFKSIYKIAQYLGKKDNEVGVEFSFGNSLKKFTKMDDKKLEYIAKLIELGLDPNLHSTVADYAFDQRFQLANGVYTEDEFIEMLNAKNAGKTGKSIPYMSTASKEAKEAKRNSVLASAITAESQNNEIKETLNKSSEGSEKSTNKQRKVNSEGKEVYTTTDGSEKVADTEDEHDRKKEEDAKDSKDSERQGNIISRALEKMGFKGKDDDKKEKSKGLFGGIVDTFKGLFSGGLNTLGLLAGGGFLLTVLGPVLPGIIKSITDTVMPAVSDVMVKYIIPGLKDILISALPAIGDLALGAAKSLFNLSLGKKTEEVHKKDENGNPMYDENGNPIMEEQTVDDENASWMSQGLGLAATGFITHKIGKKLYGAYKFSKNVFKAGKRTVDVAKGLSAGKSAREAWKASKAASEAVKTADKAKDAAKSGQFFATVKDKAVDSFNKVKDAFKNTASKAWDGAKNFGGKVWDKAKDLGSKALDVAKKGASAAYDFCKNLLTKGIEKITDMVPKFKDKAAGMSGKLATIILETLKKNGTKFAQLISKATASIAVAATGIGAIAMSALKFVDLGASIIRGKESWYNVANVLADEDPPDDMITIFTSIASAMDSVLFGIFGPDTFFTILGSVFGYNEILAPMRDRAQKAMAEYNAQNGTKYDSIEDYNDEVVLKGEGGLLNDTKRLFGFGDSKKPIKNPYSNDNKVGAGKTKPTGRGSTSVDLPSNNTSVSSGASSTSGLLGSAFSKVSMKDVTDTLGVGKFFKQNDPKYANIGFNTPGDSINQTIGDSGCGPTAGANALRALGAGIINPVEASQFALSGGFKGKDTGIYPDFFQNYAASHGAISYQTDTKGTMNALANGNPVVLQGESRGGTSSSHPFGTYPHYVTATGFDPKTGKVTIQDPESNKDNLKYNIGDVLKHTTTANAFGRGLFGRGKYKLTQGIRLGRGGNDNVPKIWKKLHDIGFGDVHSAAIMGNMAIESGFDPGIHQQGGGGFGLCQWDDRKSSLEQFASSRGTSASDLDTQIDFIKYELDGSESAAAKSFLATTDVDNATEVFCREYERPDMSVANLEGRKAAAREILNNKGTGISTDFSKFGNGSSTASKPQGLFSGIFQTYKSIKSSLYSLLGLEGGDSGSSNGPGNTPYSGGTAPGDPNSTLKGYSVDTGSPYYGFDDKYVTEWHSEGGETNLKDVQPIVKAKMNGIAKEYFEATNQKLTITGAAEHGPHAYGEYSHPTGWKIDLDSSTNTGTIVPILQKYNVAAGNEGSHLDLNFGSNGVGGDPITTRTEVQGASKFGRFGRSKDISRDPAFHPDNLNKGKSLEERDVVNEKAIAKMVKYNAEKNLELFRSGKPSILGGMGTEGPTNINQNQYTAPVEISQSNTNNDLIVQLLNSIYVELTKITGNTAGIGGLQTAQANTESRLDSVQTGLQASIGSLGNILNNKINDVSQHIQGQVNQVTKNVSGNTINQLQYLASK